MFFPVPDRDKANTQFVYMAGAGNGFFIMAASSTGSTASGSTEFVPPSGRLVAVRGLSKLFAWST